MATMHLANDATNRVIVEWNKYPPHYRVIDGGLSKSYHTEKAAIRAARRLCKQLGLTLERSKYSETFR